MPSILAALLQGAALASLPVPTFARSALSAPAAPLTEPSIPRQESRGRTDEVLVLGRRLQPSPEWTQDRVFPGTRFWRLDYGKIELEGWWRGKIRGGDDNDVHLYQAEAEIGIWPGIQLDVYEIVEKVEGDSLRQEGGQIETRIAPYEYGEIFANPTLYLEWHPQHFEPDKLETRLLLGGELAPGWVGATNLKYEVETGGSSGVEYGWTAAASREIVEGALRLGAEGKVDLEREKGTAAVASFAAGPNFLWKPLGPDFKVMFTGFFGIGHDAPDFEPILILGYSF